jgi:hypothetical protein
VVQGFGLELKITWVTGARKVFLGPGAEEITYQTAHQWGKLQDHKSTVGS